MTGTPGESAEPRSPEADELDDYVGCWVVLRAGRVIAHDVDEARLRGRVELQAGDTVVPIGPPRGGYHAPA